MDNRNDRIAVKGLGISGGVEGQYIYTSKHKY